MPLAPLPDPDDYGHPPAPLTSSLDRVLAGLGAPPAPVLTVLAERWSDVVGPAAADHCRPRSVVDGCLNLEVDSSAWASQLRWQQSDLLARVEALVGARSITSVAVRVRS